MFIGNNAIKWHFVFCHCISVSLNKFCIQPSFLIILCTLHYIVRLMEKTILNFNFDYLHPSLIITLFSENFTTFSTGFNHCNFSFPSRSRSFPRMEASDSLPEFREWIFFIPFPFPNFGNGFFPFPSRSRIDPFKVGNQKGKWEILRDAIIPTFSASCTFHPIYMPSIC